MSDSKLISVILPTYNEKGNIISLIDAIHEELKKYSHEIVVVDDNSPDGTYRAIADLNYPYVKAILRTENRGFANSIRCGLENTKGDVLIVMDSDFNHSPSYLPFMIDNLKYYDCVTASRFLYGGSMDSRIRHLCSWIFNIFVRIMTGGSITDSLYGFFSIKRKIIEQCNYDDIFWGYGDYCIRLLYFLQIKNTNVLQFPAINGKRRQGEGNSRFIKVFLQYFTEVVKFSYRIRIKKNV